MTYTVAVLCAAWCSTCREFQLVIDRVRLARPDLRYVWLDIEEDSEACGEIEVETFPTLAIFRDEALLHFGPSLPHEQAFVRLLDEMANDSRQPLARAPEEIAVLGAWLART